MEVDWNYRMVSSLSATKPQVLVKVVLMGAWDK